MILIRSKSNMIWEDGGMISRSVSIVNCIESFCEVNPHLNFPWSNITSKDPLAMDFLVLLFPFNLKMTLLPAIVHLSSFLVICVYS